MFSRLSILSARWWNNKNYADMIERFWKKVEDLGNDSVKFEKKIFGEHTR